MFDRRLRQTCRAFGGSLAEKPTKAMDPELVQDLGSYNLTFESTILTIYPILN